MYVCKFAQNITETTNSHSLKRIKFGPCTLITIQLQWSYCPGLCALYLLVIQLVANVCFIYIF